MADTKLTSIIINKIFRDPEIQYGLKEFDEIRPEQVLEIFEKEKGRFYIKCLRREKDILLFNEEKNFSKPEEVIRQLWISKLTKYYNYPLDRIDLEKDIKFGKEGVGSAENIHQLRRSAYRGLVKWYRKSGFVSSVSARISNASRHATTRPDHRRYS